jgi:hypothetical protein
MEICYEAKDRALNITAPRDGRGAVGKWRHGQPLQLRKMRDITTKKKESPATYSRCDSIQRPRVNGSSAFPPCGTDSAA